VSLPIITVALAIEQDVVLARQRARRIAALLGFERQDQTRIATAVSEIARNAFQYAGGGRVEFHVEGQTAPQIFLVQVVDRGPGIADLDAILAGRYQSPTGMGLGIVGARRIMDAFEIVSSPAGTRVSLRKLLPRRSALVTPASISEIAAALARDARHDPVAEVETQNQELLRTLGELRQRQEELARLNSELEDTNRGVVALYAELDEKADHLRRADELKSRFLSNMSHEFRTPLNSIMAMSRLLIDRVDGELTEEQATQIGFIRKAAEDLYELVNDLLDLAKVEAGKIVVRPVEFDVAHLFGALRGMLRPLLVNPALDLVFEEPSGIPLVQTDEAKVSQIIRNFISNALKFTERGEVRVTARLGADGQEVTFAVADTGIGIAPEDQERVFQEFGQLDNGVQRRVRGTGLGLPLSRKLAELLGGRITLQSAPGAGSIFSLTIPLIYAPAAVPAVTEPRTPGVEWQPDPSRRAVLVVEEDGGTILLYRSFLRGSAYQVVPARTAAEARRLLKDLRPCAIVLDIGLRSDDGWSFLAELRREESTRGVPVIVVTEVADRDKALALGADAHAQRPLERAWLLDTLRAVASGDASRRILIVDDDDAARYLLKGALRDWAFVISEAASGREALDMARTQRPDLIVCDLLMPGMSGTELIRQLRADPTTREIPIVVSTVRGLAPEEQRELERDGIGVLAKQAFTRANAAAEIQRVFAGAGVEP
jgi:signal transduction histidine kinase/CheY-like chemotaxis protein